MHTNAKEEYEGIHVQDLFLLCNLLFRVEEAICDMSNALGPNNNLIQNLGTNKDTTCAQDGCSCLPDGVLA
eukprot:2878323-Amphidinium_carterae.3